MSGTMRVNDKDTWMPAGWLYDNVLENAADYLESKSPRVAELLRSASTQRSVGYLDLRSVDAAAFGAIAEAFDGARTKVVANGPQAFHDPQFYPGYVRLLDQVISMFKNDPRLQSHD